MSLKAQLENTARAYQTILTSTMSFGSRVQARRIYMENLISVARKTDNAEVKDLISSALADVSTPASPAFALRASEALA